MKIVKIYEIVKIGKFKRKVGENKPIQLEEQNGGHLVTEIGGDKHVSRRA